MQPRLWSTVPAALLSLALGVPTMAQPPVVVAVDASRSLTRAELLATTPVLQRLVRSLEPDAAVGLIEFGDAPRWIVPLGDERQRVLTALAALEATGHFTLLHDALVVAAQAMPQGGVIVLATDGRDENSATTADDVARTCTDSKVRIVAFGIGRQVNERALRRLALLTGGTYLGQQGLSQLAGLGEAVATARVGVAAKLAQEQPPAPTVQAPAAAPPAAHQPVRMPFQIPTWAYVIGALALLAAAISLVLWRRQRQEEHQVCERCGAVLEPWESECAQCRAAEEGELELATSAAPTADSAEAVLGSQVFEKMPLDEALEKTFVLGEKHVVVVKEHRKVARTFILHPDQPFTVGRASAVNSVTVSDPTVSAQHFKIVFKDDAFYAVDLGTTNGTYLNGERVRAGKLKAGDVIRAGEAEFEIRVQLARRT